MDFLTSQTYTEEQERFRQEVRAWLEENAPEDMKNPGNVKDYTEEVETFRREKMREMAKKGWLYPTHPKEYGGGGVA
jgi:alkylation response protein AidB-like acyl-CoA dehydrogenase